MYHYMLITTYLALCVTNLVQAGRVRRDEQPGRRTPAKSQARSLAHLSLGSADRWIRGLSLVKHIYQIRGLALIKHIRPLGDCRVNVNASYKVSLSLSLSLSLACLLARSHTECTRSFLFHFFTSLHLSD